MDFAALATAALEKRQPGSELRSVEADTVLSDAEKRERVERIDADVRGLEAEARDAVERGEREAEVRSLAERAGGLVVPGVPEDRPGAWTRPPSCARWRAVSFGRRLRPSYRDQGATPRTRATPSRTPS
jgi:hypothetical protein